MFSRLARWDGSATLSIGKPLGIVWVSNANGGKSPTAPFLVWAPPFTIFSLFVGEVNGRAQSFFSEAEHQSASSAECTEFFSGGPEFFLILVSSVLAPTFNPATPGSPPTPPSEVQVAAPRALPTPNQRQR